MKRTTQGKPNSRPRNGDGFSFGSGPRYADKAQYAEKKLLFTILAIAFEPGRGYEGADRWAVTVQVEGRESEIITLESNPKRDEELHTAQSHLKRKGPIKGVRLVRSGNAYYFRSEGA